jgi:2,3,4,5-tetrahydropyridine-2-carboxylate N-succinyltransferase
MDPRQHLIEEAWNDRSKLKEADTIAAVESVLADLDAGKLRVATPPQTKHDAQTKPDAGSNVGSQADAHAWTVHQWIKQAVLLYFPIRQMATIEVGPFEFHDKIPLKSNYAEQGVRVVPHAIARHGAFLGNGVVMMPSYVNIGAYVGDGTMVDTWATVGTCAQIGKNVHLSGGVGIGGVLEPLQAAPVIVEDDCFIGSRCIVVEGVHLGRESVLGAGVVLTQSTRIIDVSGPEAVEHRGYVPPRSVVIPGSQPKAFAAGTFHVPCALIIGHRKASTDKKTSLNDVLRTHAVAV